MKTTSCLRKNIKIKLTKKKLVQFGKKDDGKTQQNLEKGKKEERNENNDDKNGKRQQGNKLEENIQKDSEATPEES